jgi:protein tyrosine phosphatase (PTP) superfamily phosphohydrolase (DUF442 family)
MFALWVELPSPATSGPNLRLRELLKFGFYSCITISKEKQSQPDSRKIGAYLDGIFMLYAVVPVYDRCPIPSDFRTLQDTIREMLFFFCHHFHLRDGT